MSFSEHQTLSLLAFTRYLGRSLHASTFRVKYRLLTSDYRLIDRERGEASSVLSFVLWWQKECLSHIRTEVSVE
jgi:hypothetical protein